MVELMRHLSVRSLRGHGASFADVAVISLDMYNDASRLIDSNFDGEPKRLTGHARTRG